MRSCSLILTSVGILLGCHSDPTGLVRDEAAPLQTDRLGYELKRDVRQFPDGPVVYLQTSIDYRYRNPTKEIVYLVKCSTVSFRLQRRDDAGEWLDVWAGPDYQRCLGPPTVIEVGASISGTLQIAGFEPNSQAIPQLQTGELADGLYRLILMSAVYLEDAADYPDGRPVEPDHLYSNHFALDVR